MHRDTITIHDLAHGVRRQKHIVAFAVPNEKTKAIAVSRHFAGNCIDLLQQAVLVTTILQQLAARQHLAELLFKPLARLVVTQAEGGPTVETDFWRGRLDEISDVPRAAVLHYASALARSAHHPLSVQARARLGAKPLAATARREGERLAASSRTSDLLKASVLLTRDSPQELRAREMLARRAVA